MNPSMYKKEKLLFAKKSGIMQRKFNNYEIKNQRLK